MSGSRPDPIYVAARRVLLDALDGLAPFRDAIILIGAQAIYLHAGEAGLPVPPYTTDADLALNPELLVPDPKLDATMRAAGFAPAPDLVGIWLQDQRTCRSIFSCRSPSEALADAGPDSDHTGIGSPEKYAASRLRWSITPG